VKRWGWFVAAGFLALALALWALLSADGEPSEATPGPRMTGTSAAYEAEAHDSRADAGPPRHAASAINRRDDLDVPPTVGSLSDAGDASTSDAGALDPTVKPSTLSEWLKENAAEAEKNVDEFCADAKKLEHLPPMPSGADHDASSFLTVRLDWEENSRPNGLLHLPEALEQRVQSYGIGWPVAITDDDLAGLDFSWMSELQKYDHWDLLAEGPLREYREADFYRAPIPNFRELFLWAKLRIARAARIGDFAAASADIHQLVALLRTTQTVVADMVSVQLLNIERVGFSAEGGRVPDGLAVAEDDTDLERHVGRAAMYFFFPGVSPEVMKKAYECNKRFRCAPLFDGLGARVTSLADESEPLLSMIDAAGCSAEQTRWIRNARPRGPAAFLEDMGSPDIIDRALHAPFPR
jgi:hypothetical protein